MTGLGIGLMGLSGFYGKVKPDEQCFALLSLMPATKPGSVVGEQEETRHACAKHRLTLQRDSADMYMDSEELIGKWLAKNPDKRENIFLATKYVQVRSSCSSVGADGAQICQPGATGWHTAIQQHAGVLPPGYRAQFEAVGLAFCGSVLLPQS